jgi:hypothetical protein
MLSCRSLPVPSRQGIVRVSGSRLDAGVALAVTALVSFGITIAQEAGARPPQWPTRSAPPGRSVCWRVAAGRSRS